MSVAWLFPGQGSQSVGMAGEWLRASRCAREALDEGARSVAFGQDLPVERYGPRVAKVWKAKLEVGTTAELARLAIRHGIVSA